jgi:excisionase family DNA binding protein
MADAPPVAEDRWLTMTEAAALVRVERRTLYNWIARGKLTVRRTANGNPRVREADLWAAEERKGEHRADALTRKREPS